MFLTENFDIKNSQYYEEATTDVSYMYDAILEANEAYHDLCMKMIKCEHTCIVNEDTVMLAEAEKTFKEKVAAVSNTLWEKFKAFCARVAEEFMKIIATVGQKMTKPENSFGKKVKLDLDGFKKACTDIAKIENILKRGIVVQDANNELLSKFKNELARPNSEKVTEVTIEGSLYRLASTYVDRLKSVTSSLRRIIRDCDKLAKDQEVSQSVHTYVVSHYTALINTVRSWVSTAVRIIFSGVKAKKAAQPADVKKESAIFFLEDTMYEMQDADPLNEAVSIMTPIHLLYQSFTGHSMERLKELERSYKEMKTEGQKNRLLGRIRRSIATANDALDTSILGQLKKFSMEPMVAAVLKNLDSCKTKTKEYLKGLNELEKKVESKKL